MYYTGIHPHQIPVRDFLAFGEHYEEVVEQHTEQMKNIVAAGVAEVVENIDFR